MRIYSRNRIKAKTVRIASNLFRLQKGAFTIDAE
jgi:hypothetical protein